MNVWRPAALVGTLPRPRSRQMHASERSLRPCIALDDLGRIDEHHPVTAS
jgi:hypothetical protein